MNRFQIELFKLLNLTVVHELYMKQILDIKSDFFVSRVPDSRLCLFFLRFPGSVVGVTSSGFVKYIEAYF